MAEKLYLLTARDHELIQQVLRGQAQALGNTSSGQQPNDNTVTAPEVYVAIPDEDGISARSGATPGTGLCQIYRLIDGEILDAGFTRTVYNFSEEDVTGYLLVTRDKYGTWWVLPSPTELLDAFTSCKGKLGGLRANECILFSAPANAWFGARSFGGRWMAGGWTGYDWFLTGDGITYPVLFRKADGGMGLRLVGQTRTWYATDLGCVKGKQRFSVPYCPPDSLDGSGSDSDTPDSQCAALVGCDNHTFNVDVICTSCATALATRATVDMTSCEWGDAVSITLYVTITAGTGGFAALVGVTFPIYYIGGGWQALQDDASAFPTICPTWMTYRGYPTPVNSDPQLFTGPAAGCNLSLMGVVATPSIDGTAPLELSGSIDLSGTYLNPDPPPLDMVCVGTVDFVITETPP